MKCRFAGMICILLALVLLLGGCGDPVKEIEKEIEKIEENYSAQVVKYDGGEVTAREVMGTFKYMYETYYSYLSTYGYEISVEEITALMGSALQTRTRMEIAAARFDAVHSLSEEELAQIEADAKAQYDEAYAQALALAEGKSDAEKDAAARRILAEAGVDYDCVYDNLLLGEKTSRMEESLSAEITALSQEELLAAYEDRISTDEEKYTSGAAYFELDMTDSDSLVCWRPEGFRAVKHVLLVPAEDVLAAYSEADTALTEGEAALEALEKELQDAKDDDSEEGPARSVEELQTLIAEAEATVAALEADVLAAAQACREDVKSVSDEIYARYGAGESIDALIAEYGQDPGMQVEPTQTRGYCVSAESIIWNPSFRDGAMAIANVGELSTEPVVSVSGVHIICYAEEIVPGPVPLEEIREALEAEVLENTRSNYADETIEAWIAETNPEYDVDAFAEVLVQGE